MGSVLGGRTLPSFLSAYGPGSALVAMVVFCSGLQFNLLPGGPYIFKVFAFSKILGSFKEVAAS